MTTSRHKALGLALMAVLGLMAFGAASVQAQTQGYFLLDGVKAVVGGTLSAKLESETGNILHSTVGGEKVLVSCKEVSAASGGAVLNEKEILVELKFEQCTVETPKPCTVEEPIVAKGIALALLHKPTGGVEETYLLAHPHPGSTTFATLKFKNCVLLGNVPIKGLPVFKDCQSTMLTDKAEHLIQETKLGLSTEEGLKFGANPASLLGSALVTRTGGSWAAH
jgi:hypothetical protein